ncbi:hypothetical protein B0A54_10428 [Friedmanniomyces endolithicus]|uniref:Uncharacterized protein n=1 Tax=Friedmanniomyces endolithicus TaxID=329885 RepID=A0A4V5N9A9_9PEZI|nr:hypothetical protein B0A54_10428 [Friedmanniomyces endolithicus]
MTLYTIATLALAFATFSDLADAHIKLASPVPYGKATLDTSPLKDAKPGSPGSDFPCKQRSGVYDLTERTQIVAGADNPLTFDGSATHGGGSGFLAVTTDEHPDVNSQWKTFMVFDSGMPVKGDSESGSGTSSYTYALPKGMLNGNLTLGWYWYNRIGNRELYSNCAPLEITGGSEDRGVFDALPNAYLINLPTSECSSQEMGDTEIPNPSNAVVVKGGGTSMLAATGPSCAASAAAVTKGLSGGSGSDLPNKGISSPPLALCTNPTSNALERRTFDFFRFRTLDCVSGYFVDPQWDRLVLQCCESEPVVRHAVNAFAALHEQRFHRDASIKDGSSALQVQGSFPALQYSKALQGLQSILRAQNVSVDLIMMCILLMVHFESLRECYVPALVHIEHAIQLLHSSGSFDPSKIDPSLLRALMRLDIQGSLYLGARVPGLAFYTIALDNTLPTEIHDVMQARDLLNTWISRLFHFMRVYADEYKFDRVGMAPLEVIARSQELARTFAEIDRLLWDFMHQPTLKLNIREQHGLAVLRSRAKVNRIVAACSIYAETTIYDAYLTEFDEILNICTYVMGSDNADRRLFSVSLDEGLLSPLHFIALHCRDSRIRRSALAHLQRLPTKAGIWHVEAITRTTQMCVEFEEKWSGKPSPQCQDIPEWRRLHMAVFDGWVLQRVQPAVKARYRLRPNGMDGEWMEIEKKLEWEPGVQSDVEQLSDTFDLLAKIEDGGALGKSPADPVGYTKMHYRLQEKVDAGIAEEPDQSLSAGIAAVLRQTHAATAASGPRLGRNYLNRHRLKLETA